MGWRRGSISDGWVGAVASAHVAETDGGLGMHFGGVMRWI